MQCYAKMLGLYYIFGLANNFGYCRASINGKTYSIDSLKEIEEGDSNVDTTVDSNGDGNGSGFLHYIYGSTLWHVVRKKLSTTNIDRITRVINIDNACRKPDDMVYCFHNVTYIYNGIEQEEEFSSHDIVKLCKKFNFKMSTHFSQEAWCKQIGIPHSNVAQPKRGDKTIPKRKNRTKKPIKII